MSDPDAFKGLLASPMAAILAAILDVCMVNPIELRGSRTVIARFD